jgi:shikimate dehydrogenase/3-dehydroquinate dehydratase type I
MTKVAAVIMSDNGAEVERQARAALSKGADLAELRVDQLRRPDTSVVRKLAAAIGSHSIATLRSPEQGGVRLPADLRRDSLLKEICARRFAFVDIELEADRERAEELSDLAKRNRTTMIVSHHFTAPPDVTEVEDAVEACAAIGEVAKVAVPVVDLDVATQLVDLARAQAKRNRHAVVIGTGAAGMLTRALADNTGQEIQYAAWGRSAAAGQLPLATARRLRGRDPMVLGIVGHPLGQSLSPTIHEAALDALDLAGVYLPFDLDSRSLDGFLDAADRLRIRGFNVTIPHKETIAVKVDELDGDAERLGAVNTVALEDGWSKGYNTDVFGFRLSLRSLGLRVGGRRSLVVGAGGAAKAVVHVLLRENAKVEVTNRTFPRAQSLADAFDEAVGVVPMDSLGRSGPWDFLVNATPAGAKGFSNELPVPESVVGKASFVYDLVYNPPVTPLLAVAKRLGRPYASGLEMLLNQAAKSFELWTGRSPPVEAMRRAAKEVLG